MRKRCGLLFSLLALLFIRIPATAQDGSCALKPRLAIGRQAQVTPGQSNNMRDTPSTEGVKIGQIPPNGVVTLLDGPVCADSFNWWQVNYAGLIGWTVEGRDAAYWLAPIDAAAPSVSSTGRLAYGASLTAPAFAVQL